MDFLNFICMKSKALADLKQITVTVDCSENEGSAHGCEGKASDGNSGPGAHEIDCELLEDLEAITHQILVSVDFGGVSRVTRSQVRHHVNLLSCLESIILFFAVLIVWQESQAVSEGSLLKGHCWEAKPCAVQGWELFHGEIGELTQARGTLERVWVDQI